MSRITELFDKISDAIEGHEAGDIMSALTAVTASVLNQHIRDGRTLDDAMVVFKAQVQRCMDKLPKAETMQ